METPNIQHGFIDDIKKGKLPWHKEDSSKLKNKIQELEKKVKALESTLTAKNREIAVLKGELERARNENADIISQFELEKKTALGELETKNAELNTQNEQLNSNLQALTDKYNNLYSLFDEEKTKTTNLQDEIKDYEKKNKVLEKEKSELSDKLEGLRKFLKY